MTSSSSSSLATIVDAWLVVLVLQFLVSLCHVLVKYVTTHSAAQRARQLDAELTSQRAKAKPLNSPATFVEYAKATRNINRLEKERAALELQLRSVWIDRVGTLQTVLRCCIVAWFWNVPMFVLPHDYLWPVSYWLRMPGWPADHIGVLAWSTICTAVANTILLQP